MTQNPEIVLLATAGSEVEALIWKDELEAEGIVVMLQAGGPGPGAWASSASFEHNVFVRADQLALARNVLEGATERLPSLPRARKGAPRVNRVTRGK